MQIQINTDHHLHGSEAREQWASSVVDAAMGHFAEHVTGLMLGIPAGEAIGESEVNDVVGEASNMLTGGLKSWLCDAGAPCAVSTPGIIRGVAFSIEPMPDVHRDWMVFDCDGERFMVEFHNKFTKALPVYGKKKMKC